MTAEGKADKVIERSKGDAAKLGANGILLHGVGDKAGGSVGPESAPKPLPTFAYGSASLPRHSSFHKSGDGVAIYGRA